MSANFASSHKVAQPGPRHGEGERVRLQAHARPQSQALRSVLFFGLGLVVGLSLTVILVTSGHFPNLPSAGRVDSAADFMGRLGGKGCKKRVFDNQTGQVTEVSCDTTASDANNMPLPPAAAERVNAIGKWFRR
jgi:hypothetical protein